MTPGDDLPPWSPSGPMEDGSRHSLRSRGTTARSILRDVQFWIPVLVLIGGLAVLGWIR